jgi:hypothetical protein
VNREFLTKIGQKDGTEHLLWRKALSVGKAEKLSGEKLYRYQFTGFVISLSGKRYAGNMLD